MTKKGKAVRSVKGQEGEKKTQIQAIEGNTGTLTVALLNQILEEIRKLNGRLE